MDDRLAPYLLDYRPNLMLMLRRYHPQYYTYCRNLSAEQLLISVLTSPRVQRLILAVAARENKDVSDVTKAAKEILADISHRLSITSARPVVYSVTKLGAHLFDDISINVAGLEKWKSKLKDVPLVFVPSHRSYADFLLLSPLCFAHDVPVPLVVAGEDFKAMTFIGKLLRHCGAFYMQRSFTKDLFYKTIFSEYVHAIMEDGANPIEFFIEGTRSRTGKALHPKMGIIGYVFDQFFRGVVGDFALCPISVSYERPLEEDSHVLSMLGVGKPKERSTSMIRGIHNVLQKPNGRIRLHIADPFHVHEEYSDRVNRMIHSQHPRVENFAQMLRDSTASAFLPGRGPPLNKDVEQAMRTERTVVRECSYRIVGIQQQYMVVYPRYMVASILLQTVGRQMPLAQMAEEVIWLKKCLVQLGAHDVALDEFNVDEEVRRAVSLLHPPVFIDNERKVVRVQEDVSFATRPDVDLMELCTNAKDYPVVFCRAAIELQLVYPHNQLVHVIHDVSILSVLLDITPTDYPLEQARHEFAVLAGVLREEFVFGIADADPQLIFNNAVERLSRCGSLDRSKSDGSLSVTPGGQKLVQFLAKTVHPLLASVWVFGTTILQLSAGQPEAFFKATTTIPEAQIEACKLLAQGQLTFYRCIGTEILKAALQSLVHCRLLKRDAESDNICIVTGQQQTLISVLNMLGGILKHAGQRVHNRLPHGAGARL
eukprot:scpid19491/ scgid16682/ Dihydroxyacetone phosphate acyltransferase; Acyl-CoA:dihydroxyacetonephosphateacyltransferase; Glycerone-phosphate O-acyltransferase